MFSNDLEMQSQETINRLWEKRRNESSLINPDPLPKPKPTRPGLPQHSKPQGITREKLNKFIPKGTAHAVTTEVMDMIGNLEKDTNIIQEYMEENILSYIGILSEVKCELKEYVNAVKYCTLKQNLSNSRAWEIVFPEKMNRLIEMKKIKGDAVNIDSHVSNYNKSKLVIAIDKMLLIPPSIQYAPLFHEAMMVKVNLMRGIGAKPSDRVSPTVQLAAAIAVTDKTQMPEDNTIELKLGMSDEAKTSQQNLADQIAASVALTKAQLKAGVPLSIAQKIGIQGSEVIDAEIEE